MSTNQQQRDQRKTKSNKQKFEKSVAGDKQIIDKENFTGQKLRAGSDRKAPKIAETWKQCFHRKIFGFFSMISDRFLSKATGN